jgi:hypothetical protein
MKTWKLLTLLGFFLSGSLTADAQAKTGKVYFIRVTGYAGTVVNYSFYVDGQLICKQKNKSYSVHDLSVGDHTIAISGGGLSNGRKSTPLKITVQEGKTNYISVVGTQSGYVNKINCQEITQNSAEPLLAKAKQKTDCLAKE